MLGCKCNAKLGDNAMQQKKTLSNFFGVFPATRPYPGNTELRKEVGHKIGERLIAL
jgi:hypothetical protein